MQVGRVSYGYGTSALWHDPDYTLRLDYPTKVQKALDTTLPYQEHFEPDLPSDPFTSLEKSYDVAFAQMARGREGRDFLHGTRHDAAFDAAAQVQQRLRTKLSSSSTNYDSAGARAVEKAQEAAPPPPGRVKSSNSSRTASDVEAETAAEHTRDHNQVTEALSMAGGVIASAAVAGGQAKAAEVVAGQAAKAASAVTTVANTAATSAGQAVSVDDYLATDMAFQRRDKPTYQANSTSVSSSLPRLEDEEEEARRDQVGWFDDPVKMWPDQE